MNNLPASWSPAAQIKRTHLRQRGMCYCGEVLIDLESGRRATIDYCGRVQWWDVDESGRMHAQAQRVADLERHITKIESERRDLRAARDEAWARVEELVADNLRLRHDELRLDWLADPVNNNGAVQLPYQCVIENMGSMRAAIDASMRLNSKGQK